MTKPESHVTGCGDTATKPSGPMPEVDSSHVTKPVEPMVESESHVTKPGGPNENHATASVEPMRAESENHVTQPETRVPKPMMEPGFLVCCSCTDNCSNRSKCECWQLTLEEAKVLGNTHYSVGYVHQRLKRPQHSA